MATNETVDVHAITARVLLATIANESVKTQEKIVTDFLVAYGDGLKTAVVEETKEMLVRLLGEQYRGPGKLRDRVRALEDIARSAAKVVAFDGDIMSAAFEARIADLTAALEPLGTAPPPKTG